MWWVFWWGAEFRLSTYNLYKTEEGIWEFTIHFTSSETIQRVKELEDVIDPSPNVEATAILSENEITMLLNFYTMKELWCHICRLCNYYANYLSYDEITSVPSKLSDGRITMILNYQTIKLLC